jgi:hypothetical protein
MFLCTTFIIKPIGVVADAPSFANGCCIFPNYRKSFIKQGLICKTPYKCWMLFLATFWLSDAWMFDCGKHEWYQTSILVMIDIFTKVVGEKKLSFESQY